MPAMTHQPAVDALPEQARGVSVGDRAGHSVRQLIEPDAGLAGDLGKDTIGLEYAQ